MEIGLVKRRMKGITMRSEKAEMACSSLMTEAPFKVSGSENTSAELYFTTGITGKSNSTKNFASLASFDPTTFLAVRRPDFATNSTASHSTWPDEIR